MQQTATREQVEYASVGWRVAAVLVDTAVLFGLLFLAMVVWLVVLVAQGRLDPNDPAAVQEMAQQIGTTSDWTVNAAFFGALFVYYALLEGFFGASVGKLVFRMRVVMIDGSRPTGVAVVVRNLIRIPEAWLLYIPAGVSSLASSRRQRLGDHVARTVVVRRAAMSGATALPCRRYPTTSRRRSPTVRLTHAQSGEPGHGEGLRTGEPGEHAPPASLRPEGSWPAAPGAWAPAEAAPAPSLDDAMSGLKTAVLAARGAHLTYLQFSERELAADEGSQQGEQYSDEYVSAWFTLADAVASFRQAHAAAETVAATAGRTLDEACALQPDLAHLLRELAPYLAAESDEQVHEAFLVVARAEAKPS